MAIKCKYEYGDTWLFGTNIEGAILHEIFKVLVDEGLGTGLQDSHLVQQFSILVTTAKKILLIRAHSKWADT